jgi:uncharacterized protein involved in type VI secretion and phage assembly
MYIGLAETAKLDANGCLRVNIAALDGVFDCRVAMLLAGAGRGMIFLPEPGDQVLVSRVDGTDVEFVLLGSLLSANAAPPALDGADSNDTKLIQTRGGNQIRLIDTDGEESIEITTKAQQRIHLSAKQDSIRMEVGENGSISIQGGTINLLGNVNISGVVTIGGTNKTTIDGNTITGS